MTTQTNPKPHRHQTTPEQVIDFLRTNPSFFENQASLLESLRLPHNAGGAVSLIERQVLVLRNKNKNLEDKFLSLVKAAKTNETLNSRMHTLALALMQADSLDDVLAIAQEQLVSAFKADVATIRVLNHKPHKSELHCIKNDQAELLFHDAFESHRPLCGRLNDDQLQHLFCDETDTIHSAVFVPMSTTEPLGYLALGSHDKQRFHPGMGTLFLDHLGELITQATSAQIHRERD